MHRALGKPPGPREPDVVGSQDLEHLGAHQPHDQRHLEQRERDGGHDQGLQPGNREQAGRPPGADMHHLAAAERGQPAQQHREEIDQQDADQERRQRYADERQRLEQLGERAVAAQSRVYAHRDSRRQRQDRGDEREFERRGHARADQIDDRLLELIGDAEIEARRIGEKAQRLDDHGLVETELMAQLLALDHRGLDSDHLVHGIADISEHREGDQPDRDQDADRREEAAEDEGDHRGRRWSIQRPRHSRESGNPAVAPRSGGGASWHRRRTQPRRVRMRVALWRSGCSRSRA